MSDTETIVVTGDHIAVDLLLWRRFQRKTPGLVEKVLALNPGISERGPFIPAGTAVIIPVERMSAPAQRPLIKLFD